MLRNDLVIALRNARRRPGTAALHVGGLALGLACCLLVALYVQAELSFDRFHDRPEEVVLVGQELVLGGEPVRMSTIPPPLAEALQTTLPEVESLVRTGTFEATITPESADEGFREPAARTAGPAFFDVFTFPLLDGDPATALAEPNTAVVTERAAQRYFGTTDAVGRTLLVRPRNTSGFQLDLSGEPVPLRITAVAADPPTTSTIDFDLLISEPTMGDAHRHFALGGAAFVRLREGTTPEAFAAALDRLGARLPGQADGGRLVADPLLGLHFASAAEGFSGDRLYLYLFSTVALFILLLAGVNYVNLSTAQAARRAGEVGVRKALGAGRGELARQFLVEAVLAALVAAALALALAALALPGFNALFGTALRLDLARDPGLLVGLGGAALVVGVLAGAYPALYLSKFRPVTVLRGEPAGPRGTPRLRQGLVVTQFAITTVLLIGTTVVHGQLRHLEARPRGVETERMVTLTLGDPEATRLDAEMKRAAEAIPGVERVTATSEVPGQIRSRIIVQRAEEGAKPLPVHYLSADADVFAAYGIEVIREMGLREALRSPDGPPVRLLNETAARQLGGLPADGVIELEDGPVAGIIRDFPFASGREPIGPLVLYLQSEEDWDYGRLTVRVREGQLGQALPALREAWRQIAPGRPFEHAFVDEVYGEMYAVERRLGRVFAVFAGLAVVVACLGLFGLAAFSVARRTKEIGIRKVLGASVTGLVRALVGDFARLLAVAVVVAAPIAYLLARRWLEDFAYRVDLGPGPFLLAGGLVLAVALLTVGTQALRAATSDPVKALRHE